MAFNPTENEALELKFRANSFEYGCPILGMAVSAGSLVYDIGSVFWYAIGGIGRACIMDWTHSARCFRCCGYSLQACAYSIIDLFGGLYGTYRTNYSEDGKIDLLAYRILKKQNGATKFDPIGTGTDVEEAKKRILAAGGELTPVATATTKELMERNPLFFYYAKFNPLAEKYVETFHPAYNEKADLVYAEEKLVDKETQIFVQALHGDLPSLKKNLKMLQEQGLLDEKYICKKKVHLVFLINYDDTCAYPMQVLELLMTLRMENPDQVTLIRGNCFLDRSELLTQVDETMPLGLYLGQKDEAGVTQYALYTHSVFESSFKRDPFLMNLTANVPKGKGNTQLKRLDNISIRNQKSIYRNHEHHYVLGNLFGEPAILK